MLIRHDYYEEKHNEIKQLVLQILDNLMLMTDHFEQYLKEPSKENIEFILKKENHVDQNEQKIEKYILEIISLEQLNTREIKWLFAISRIIRELERVGDQLTNIITLSDVIDIDMLRPMIKTFFHYEQDMILWLRKGIDHDDSTRLYDVIAYDKYVNHLNKETYQGLVEIINDKKRLNESSLKMVIISRFLERIGDHLVNAALTYKGFTDTEKENR